MAGNFDPYYKWLGIPPKDQPPHFYKLLGIELYESDPEVITIAAEQRLRHVQTFQTGEYALISQKLQKKIIAVREYLLDPEKKAEYDTSLKLQLRHKPAQAAPPIQTTQSYQIKKPQTATASPPVQSHNTDYSTNPVVIFKETMAWFREHKKVTATIIKLVYATIAVVVLLILVVNGRTLLPFIVDKSSYLIAKVTGSSDEKPLENRAKVRVVPGAKTENPENPSANSGENAPAQPGTRANPVLPPPPPTDAGATAGPNPQDSAPTANTSDQSGERSSTGPPEITSLNLPSGKIFKARSFKVELSTLSDLFKDPTKDDPVLCMYYPDGRISALATHNKGVLNGVTMAFHEDYKPKTYAAYADGAIDGIIKLWNEKGERIYWCQYEKGVRNGLCCYFKDNALQMILEIDHDTISGIHLCAGGELKKSFSSLEQASADKVAQKLLDEVDGLETELKLNEGLFKKQVKDELQRLKQEKMGIMTPQKRAAIQERARVREFQGQSLVKSLRNCCSL